MTTPGMTVLVQNSLVVAGILLIIPVVMAAAALAVGCCIYEATRTDDYGICAEAYIPDDYGYCEGDLDKEED